MFSRRWWRIASNRAARSTAQAFLLTVGPTAAQWIILDWRYLLYATVGSGVLSLAHSVLSSPVPNEEQQ